MPIVAVALGSNLGDRRSHLDFAASALHSLLLDLRVSSYYETVPEEMTGPQPLFLNAAAVGGTLLPPHDLLQALLDLEKERGRERPFPRAPRTLDLDLVLFGNQVVREPGLTVPHPHYQRRRFVLEPLAEIAPDLRDPITRKTIGELLEELTRSTPSPEAPRR